MLHDFSQWLRIQQWDEQKLSGEACVMPPCAHNQTKQRCVVEHYSKPLPQAFKNAWRTTTKLLKVLILSISSQRFSLEVIWGKFWSVKALFFVWSGAWKWCCSLTPACFAVPNCMQANSPHSCLRHCLFLWSRAVPLCTVLAPPPARGQI